MLPDVLRERSEDERPHPRRTKLVLETRDAAALIIVRIPTPLELIEEIIRPSHVLLRYLPNTGDISTELEEAIAECVERGARRRTDDRREVVRDVRIVLRERIECGEPCDGIAGEFAVEVRERDHHHVIARLSVEE